MHLDPSIGPDPRHAARGPGGPAVGTPHTRRAFLGRLAAVGAGAAVGAQALGLRPAYGAGGALAPTVVAGGGSAVGAIGATGTAAADAEALQRLLAGFRAATSTRLNTLEAAAGLAKLPADQPFRRLTLDRLKRLESLHGVTAPPRGESVWRNWIMARVATLELYLPRALRFPFYTHLPIDVPSGEYGPVLRERIAEGSCNGIFLYKNAHTPLGPSAELDSITSSGGPVPILMSPKNVSDPAQLAAWMQYWADRPEWIPYVRVAFWQEPQGDFGGEDHPPVTKYHEGVITLADAADKVGIASVAHVETWHLHPDYQPDGGVPRLLELLQPVIKRIGGGISWSIFVFNEKDEAANSYVRWMNEFMAEYFPYSCYGVGAYGDAVPVGLAADDPRRHARAARVASALSDLDESPACWGGYYALPVGPDPTRNFWDEFVRGTTVEAMGYLGD